MISIFLYDSVESTLSICQARSADFFPVLSIQLVSIPVCQSCLSVVYLLHAKGLRPLSLWTQVLVLNSELAVLEKKRKRQNINGPLIGDA